MGQAGSVYTTDIDKHCESRLLDLSCGGLVAKSWQTLVTPWTVARQAPLSMGFSRQEYWSGLPCPPPGDLPDLGIEPASLDVLCIDRWILGTSTTWGAQVVSPGVKISKCFPLMLHLVL